MQIVKTIYALLVVAVALPLPLSAQTLQQDLRETLRAEVLEILSEEEMEIFGTGAVEIVQEVRIELESGEEVEFENDLVPLRRGDRIYVNYMQNIDGTEFYTLKDVDRRSAIILLPILFAAILISFAGWQGVRALLSLGASIGAIIFVLVPALLAGYDPVLTSLGIAGVILAVVLFGTHGFNARSMIAFFGTFGAVAITCVVALFWTQWMRLTGFAHDASVYLNFATAGELDFAGLLLGSIIIGILGVLDDVSITQASVVQELKAANPTLTGVGLYHRAIRVGKDHVGSLVNTLALAYVGAALPLVLLMVHGGGSLMSVLNQEVVAAEYIRILIGSIGLLLAVPLTTGAAAWWWHAREVDEHDVCEHGHHHHH